MPIKMSAHRLALQHGSSRTHCHKGDLPGYLYPAHCHGNRKSYEMQTLHTEVFVLSCRSHTQSFLPPSPGAFMAGWIVRSPESANSLNRSQNLGMPGAVPAGGCPQPWILQPCSDSPVTGAPVSAWPLQAGVGSPSAIPEGHSCGEGAPRLNSHRASCLPRDAGSYSHGVGGSELRVWWWAPCQELRGVSNLWTSTHPLLLYTKHFLFKQPHARVVQDGSSSSCGHIWHWLCEFWVGINHVFAPPYLTGMWGHYFSSISL